MKKIEHVLKVCKDGAVFNVEWVIDRDAPLKSIEAVLCSVFETAIKAANDMYASDEEALKMIISALNYVTKDLEKTRKYDVIITTQENAESCEETK